MLQLRRRKPIAGTGCKKKAADPFPASGAVAGWEKTSDTRTFAAKDLWQYIDGDAEQYISAGVVSTSTSDYKYQGQLEATVDVHTMKRCAGRAQDSGNRRDQGRQDRSTGRCRHRSTRRA
jgi:hypothetical protein